MNHPNDVAFDDDDDEPPMLVAVPVEATEQSDAGSKLQVGNVADAIPQESKETKSPTKTHDDDSKQQSKNDDEVLPSPPCPVTILSGFLGSGKTTLIQYILKSPDHGKRIAVIENEFGDGLSVESLIARDGVEQGNSTLQDLIELPNGCICCTVKDSLIVTLETLLTKRNDLDYILIEASGMANPGPIASVFWLDEELESRLRLDGIVTLVDAMNISHQLEETEEAAQQIAYADRILLNKMDLLPGQQHEQQMESSSSPNEHVTTKFTNPSKDFKTKEEVVSLIRSIHPTAPLRTTTYSQVPDLEWLLDTKSFEQIDHRVQQLESLLSTTNVSEEENHQHGHHDHHHDHDQSCDQCQATTTTTTSARSDSIVAHRHTSGISTIALRLNGSVNLSKINSWLAEILWPNQDAPDKVLRSMLETPLQNDESKEQQEQAIKSATATTTSTKDPRTINPNNRDAETQVIYRIKGILSVVEDTGNDPITTPTTTSSSSSSCPPSVLDPRRFIVQAVYDLWEVYPGSKELLWEPTMERTCKLVVIGRGLNADQLQTGFSACAAIGVDK